MAQGSGLELLWPRGQVMVLRELQVPELGESRAALHLLGLLGQTVSALGRS